MSVTAMEGVSAVIPKREPVFGFRSCAGDQPVPTPRVASGRKVEPVFPQDGAGSNTASEIKKP